MNKIEKNDINGTEERMEGRRVGGHAGCGWADWHLERSGDRALDGGTPTIPLSRRKEERSH